VADAPITLDSLESLEVHPDLAAQIALDHALPLDA
jgi:hypothetical protein